MHGLRRRVGTRQLRIWVVGASLLLLAGPGSFGLGVALAPPSPLPLLSTGPGGNNSTSGGVELEFLESGLPAGGHWSVTVGSRTATTNGSLLVIPGLTTGVHAFTVSTPLAFSAYPANGTIDIQGSTSVAITFYPNPSPAPTFLGLPVLEAEILAALVIGGAGAAVFAEWRSRRRPPQPGPTTATPPA
jgi:hypothetical protein